MKVRTSKVLKSFGQWVVTNYGLECKTTPYAIEKKSLFEEDWERHVCQKVWVNGASFRRALAAAREIHKPRSRFRRIQEGQR